MLASASYTGNLNYTGSDSLQVATTDAASGSTVTKSAAITISNANVVAETVPATLTGTENTAIALSAIVVSDSPNTGDTLTTVLTVTHGTIAIATPGGIVTGNNSSAVTLTGPAAAIDSALASASYTGNLNKTGSDSLQVATTDAAPAAAAPVSQTARDHGHRATPPVVETVLATPTGQRRTRRSRCPQL